MAKDTGPAERPARLLSRGNRNLARDRIWSWSIPALAARLPDGGTFRTCPASGICARACYALTGTYRFPAVQKAHLRNLLYVLEDPDGWEQAMKIELTRPRFRGAHIRIHDAGDLFSDNYVNAWLRIIAATPWAGFYAYTKEIDRYLRLIEPDPPPNSRWILSYGGSEDHLIDPRRHRVADVFPSEEAIAQAGFHSQAQSDLLAAYGPSPVGMAANRIPHLRRRQGQRTFSEWQKEAGRPRTAQHPENPHPSPTQ